MSETRAYHHDFLSLTTLYRAFIDIKSIKAATSGAIRAIVKQRGYSSEVPLINVGEVVGDAVVSATKNWNKLADAK